MKPNSPLPAGWDRLNSLPRVSLMAGPTPLQPLPNLSTTCGRHATMFVKRDDATDLALGGNKVRQLEFYLGEAIRQNADTILITGAVQSNFVRLAAAAARRFGMDCHIQLERRVDRDDALYTGSGNVLLDRLLGATIHHYPEGEDEEGADRRLSEIAADLRAQGRCPYIIPLAPGHPPLGALGYVIAAQEIRDQAMTLGYAFDRIFVASGSGHTHGGLLFGLRALGDPTPVEGVCVRRPADQQRPRIATRCQQIADLLQMPNPVADGDIRITDAFLAPGYGVASETVWETILLAARTEALLVDPTYTGKSLAAMIAATSGLRQNSTFLFLHTGGIPALFSYQSELEAHLGTRKDGYSSESP